MKLLSTNDFEKACGKMMPLQRTMSTFDGDSFECACGKAHVFYSGAVNVLSQGFNGKFMIVCPSNPKFVSLIKTKMKFGLIYQGLGYLAGHELKV